MQTNDFENVRVRIYEADDPELYAWYQDSIAHTEGRGEKSVQIRHLLRAGLQAHLGERITANAPQATAAIDTEELLVALLPEIRAVVSAALATAHVTPAEPAESSASEIEETPKMAEFLANLDRDLFLAG